MKRRIISILAVCCMMVAMMPAAFAVDADTATNPITVTTASELANAVSANATYDLVTLGSDITLTETLTIAHEVTLSGGADKHTLTYNGNEADGAVSITTNDPVVMDNLTVTVTNAQARGIKLASTSPKFTFSNSVLNVSLRGIWVGTSCDADSVITISNSIIQNNQIPEGKTYDTWSYLGDTRGIALWDMNDSKVEVLNSSILGFGYSINLAGTLDDAGIRDYNNTEVIVTNSTIKGWTAFNVWSAKTIFTITNSTLVGINTSNGYWDGFATIVVNDDIYNYGWGGADANVFNIYGGTITCYRTGTTSEQLFRVDNQGITEVNFSKYTQGFARYNVSIIDGTGDSDAVFYSGYEKTPDDWSAYMNAHVTGSENCTLTGYNGATLAFIPD